MQTISRERTGWGRTRPPGRVEVNSACPLAQGLLSAFACWEPGGNATDLMQPDRVATITSRRVTQHGLGLQVATLGSYTPMRGITLTTTTKVPAFSVCCGVLKLATVTSSSDYWLMKPTDGSYFVLRLRHSSGSDFVRAEMNNFTTTVIGSTPLSPWQLVHVGFTYNPVNGAMVLYRDGVVDGTGTNTNNSTKNLGVMVSNIASPAGGSGSPFSIYSYVWNRVLTPAEIFNVARQPYALVRPAWKMARQGYGNTLYYANGGAYGDPVTAGGYLDSVAGGGGNSIAGGGIG